MKKTIGYIPLDQDEQPDHKQHKIIDGQWLKLAEVWVPGVVVPGPCSSKPGTLASIHTDCGIIEPMERRFRHDEQTKGRLDVVQYCKNCGRSLSQHEGPENFCP